MNTKKAFLIKKIATLLLFTACNPIQELTKLSDLDLSPPQFKNLEVINAQTVQLNFNESVHGIQADFTIIPDLILSGYESLDHSLIISFEELQLAGQRYVMELQVQDNAANSLTMLIPFYGFNPQVPKLLINEFTTQGSGRHPDLLELYVLSPGNLAGVSCYQGTHSYWDDRFIFPNMVVEAGDYILLHFKPQGIPAECNETEAKDSSGGQDAADTAFDFWVEDGTGLSGNNGVLSLYRSPHGGILDGVLYSNRSSNSDQKYGGFGSKKVLLRALELYEQGAWQAQSDSIKPEDGINPDPSTGTRSMNRDSQSADTDSKQDWHITPTKGFSFGSQNSDQVYEGS